MFFGQRLCGVVKVIHKHVRRRMLDVKLIHTHVRRKKLDVKVIHKQEEKAQAELQRKAAMALARVMQREQEEEDTRADEARIAAETLRLQVAFG